MRQPEGQGRVRLTRRQVCLLTVVTRHSYTLLVSIHRVPDMRGTWRLSREGQNKADAVVLLSSLPAPCSQQIPRQYPSARYQAWGCRSCLQGLHLRFLHFFCFATPCGFASLLEVLRIAWESHCTPVVLPQQKPLASVSVRVFGCKPIGFANFISNSVVRGEPRGLPRVMEAPSGARHCAIVVASVPNYLNVTYDKLLLGFVAYSRRSAMSVAPTWAHPGSVYRKLRVYATENRCKCPHIRVAYR